MPGTRTRNPLAPAVRRHLQPAHIGGGPCPDRPPTHPPTHPACRHVTGVLRLPPDDITMHCMMEVFGRRQRWADGVRWAPQPACTPSWWGGAMASHWAHGPGRPTQRAFRGQLTRCAATTDAPHPPLHPHQEPAGTSWHQLWSLLTLPLAPAPPSPHTITARLASTHHRHHPPTHPALPIPPLPSRLRYLVTSYEQLGTHRGVMQLDLASADAGGTPHTTVLCCLGPFSAACWPPPHCCPASDASQAAGAFRGLLPLAAPLAATSTPTSPHPTPPLQATWTFTSCLCKAPASCCAPGCCT